MGPSGPSTGSPRLITTCTMTCALSGTATWRPPLLARARSVRARACSSASHQTDARVSITVPDREQACGQSLRRTSSPPPISMKAVPTLPLPTIIKACTIVGIAAPCDFFMHAHWVWQSPVRRLHNALRTHCASAAQHVPKAALRRDKSPRLSDRIAAVTCKPNLGTCRLRTLHRIAAADLPPGRCRGTFDEKACRNPRTVQMARADDVCIIFEARPVRSHGSTCSSCQITADHEVSMSTKKQCRSGLFRPVTVCIQHGHRLSCTRQSLLEIRA